MMGTDLISLSDFTQECENKKVMIPLLQRNYKWDIDMALKLLEDSYKACGNSKKVYTIGMLSIYEKNNMIQVIDGQQRLITFALIFKSLGYYNDFLELKFERDENCEREDFLNQGILPESVDVRHMKKTLDEINKRIEGYQIDDVKKKYFFDWMMNHIKFYCRVIENEPLQEFLNLNQKKTPFFSTDYYRAYQLKYQVIKKEINTKEIIDIHNKIQNILYTDEDIYNLVKKNNVELPNRMDYLFEEVLNDLRISSSKAKSQEIKLSDHFEKLDDLNEQEKSEEYRRFHYYLIEYYRILENLHSQIKKEDGIVLNANIYNAINDAIDYKWNNLKKFNYLVKLEDIQFDENSQNSYVQIDLENKICKIYPYIESQFKTKISEKHDDSLNQDAYQERFFYPNAEIMDLFDQRVKEVNSIIKMGNSLKIEVLKGDCNAKN